MGKRISFETEGYTDVFFATVYAVDYRIDETTRTIGLRARYNNSDGRLVPGMFASLTLITDEKQNAINRRLTALYQAKISEIRLRLLSGELTE